MVATNLIQQAHQGIIRAGFWTRYGWTRYGAAIRFLERSQWFSPERIRELQWKRLKTMLDHAYRTVPYYRGMFEQLDATPQDIRSPQNMAKLLTLTKSSIQQHLPDLISDSTDRSRLLEDHTGGSTGEPLTYYHDRHYEDWSMADKFRCYRLAGWSPGKRWAFLWGSDVDGKQHEGWRWVVDRVFRNIVWVNMLGLAEEQLRGYFARLEGFHPELIVGYVSSLKMLCDFMRHNDLVGQLSPINVQSSAEPLTPADRTLIEETLGCPVFDRYGGREFSNLAHECEAHEGLHILAENNYVEVMNGDRPAQPGEVGRIVVTNLCNFGMPFIRYEMGDLGVLAGQPCSCGRGLPLIKSIKGRTYDNVVCPSGKIMYGHVFTMLFYGLSGVRQFQVVQTDIDRLVVRLVLMDDVSYEELTDTLAREIHRVTDKGFEISFELRDNISPLRSGKRRYVISHIPAPFMSTQGIDSGQ